MKALWVLPDGERVEERLLGQTEPGRALRADGVISFGQLIEQLSRGDTRLQADELLALTILGGCARRVDLGPFAPVRESPAFIRAAAEVFSALKSGGMNAAQFSEACAGMASGGAAGSVRNPSRGLALARLYVDYQRQLDRLHICDPEDRLLSAAARARESGAPASVAAFEELHIQGLHDLPPSRLELILALARSASKGSAPRLVLHLPYAGSARVNAFLEPAFRTLEAKAIDLEGIEVVAEDPASMGGPGASLASALFGGSGTPLLDGLSLFTAASPIQEAREVARRIRRLVDSGAAVDDIAVGVRQTGEWVDRLAEEMERQGMRVRVPHGAPLGSAPPVRLALELLELSANDFPREPFAAFLGSRYLRCAASEQLGNAAAMLREAGVRDNRFGGGYRARLRALVERLSEGRDPDRAASVARRAADLDEILTTLGRLVDDGTITAHCKGLGSVLDALGVAGSAQALSDPGAASGDARLLASVGRDQVAFEGLQHLLSALPTAFSAAGRASESLSRDSFIRVLSDAVHSTLLRVRGPRGGAVRILDVRTLHGRRIPHLFLPALTDGTFPARPEPHPLFPEEDRVRINTIAGRPVFRAPAAGAEPGPLPPRQAEEPLLFYLALCSARDTVHLSCPRMDGSGREALASPFFEEVERRTSSMAAAVPLQPIPHTENARTRDEVMARVARDRLSDPALHGFEGSGDASATERALERAEPVAWASIVRRAEMERERIAFLANPELTPGTYSGRVEGSDVEALLQRIYQYDASHPLTAKHLNEFGTCAFKGFAGRALKLAAAEEVGEDSDSKTRGTLLHRILRAYFERMLAEGRLPLAGRPEEKDILDQVAEAKLQEAERELYLGHPELWRLRRIEELAKLQRTLEEEQRQPRFAGLIPARFEIASADQQMAPVEMLSEDGKEAIYLGGAIDRVDEGPGCAAVIDYKSGRANALRKQLKENLLETEFQLLAYLVLVKGSLGRAPVDAAFISLKDQKLLTLSGALAQRAGDERIEELIELDPVERQKLRAQEKRTFADRAWQLVHQMRGGQFGVRPSDCHGCDFKGVCRVGAGSLAGEDP